jgi:hypothetical protein
MKYFLPVCLLIGLVSTAQAATIAAASCQSAAVSSAANSANTGDTVTIPAGTCTWSQGVTISKAITLQGAGIGATVIVDAVSSSPLLSWSLVANQTSRMTGIEFRKGGGSHPGNNGVVVINGSTNDGRRMRVDHCKFDDLAGVALISNNVFGVFDQNIYIGTPTQRFVNVWNNSWGNVPWGDGSYAAPTGFGSANFLFVENNDITYLGAQHYAFIDGFGGARYVVRYNRITRGWVEAHGTDSTGRYRGTRAIEVYNNTFTGNNNTPYVVNMRSAVGVIHNNTISGYASDPKFVLANYRMQTSYQPFGLSNGSSPWDKNVAGVVVTSLDQPCVSGGSQISGEPPVLPWAAGNNNQVVDACYEWNNTQGGQDVSFEAAFSNIKLGIHFFQNTPKPGYTPYPYPHPLATGGGGSQGPSAPTGLRISSE